MASVELPCQSRYLAARRSAAIRAARKMISTKSGRMRIKTILRDRDMTVFPILPDLTMCQKRHLPMRRRTPQRAVLMCDRFRPVEPPVSTGSRSRSRRESLQILRSTRQQHMERRSLRGHALGEDMSAVSEDRLLGDCQAETGPEALGREERVEDPFQRVGGNAAARVAHRKADLALITSGGLLGAEHDASLIGDGLARIDEEVAEDLIELFRVSQDREVLRGKSEIEGDLGSNRAAHVV